ncbi:WD domain, G-beta repeat family protein [Candida albicans]|uniref:WD domain, G-beta repeat family protein n=1 Tax=Candida albicans TaxID=5476 RepID=A0A8H6C3S3_CANAX|nr:WD domain, G-beta repeat family protein [Candida albicans]
MSRRSKSHNCHDYAAVNSLSLETTDYQYLLSGSNDSSIKLWDLKQQETIREENEIDANLHLHPSTFDNFDYDNPVSTFVNLATILKRHHHKFGISCIQWWPYDTGMFASSSFDHTVKIWDTNELTPVHTFDLSNKVYDIDISAENALIATANDQPFIRLLDLNSTSSAHTLSGHKGKTLVVKWHPINSNILASGGYDGEVKIWDIRRSQSSILPNYPKPIWAQSWACVGSSGSLLYTVGNDDKIRVWDMVNVSTPPPINKLINFGPLIRNKHPHTIPLLLNPQGETETQFLLFPSESGDVFIFRTIDGKLVNRLARKGSRNTGRTVSMCNGGPSTAKYFCGTIDGEIISWGPCLDKPDLSELRQQDENNDFDDDEDINERLLKQFQLENKRKQFLESIEK